MNYIVDCLARFRQLPTAAKQKIGGMDSFSVVQKIGAQYGVDVSFALILVAIGELNTKDFGAYLKKKYYLSAEDAYDVENEVTRFIFSKFLLQEKETINKSALMSEFKDDLINLFKDKDKAVAFNIKAFKILSSDGAFLNDLEKILLSHDFEIGSELIFSQNRKVKQTISNWIKDFLIFNSTDNFDDIILARYMSSSDNAKNLSDEDKSLLFRVLKTYRNISFFLENSEKTPIDFLELISVDMIALDNSKNNDRRVNSLSKKEDDLLIKKEEVLPESSVEATPSINSDLAYLQEALFKYGRNSLEYRAVKQEIERLRKNKNKTS